MLLVFLVDITKYMEHSQKRSSRRMSDDQDGYIDRERERGSVKKNLVSARFFLISVVHGRNLILLLFNATHNLFLIVYK